MNNHLKYKPSESEPSPMACTMPCPGIVDSYLVNAVSKAFNVDWSMCPSFAPAYTLGSNKLTFMKQLIEIWLNRV